MKRIVYYTLFQLLLLFACYSLFTNINDSLIVGKWIGVYTVVVVMILYNILVYKNPFTSAESLYRLFAVSMLIINIVVSVHCLLQLTAILPNNTTFPATAGFDNPAGVAATLTATYPFVFLIHKTNAKNNLFAGILFAFDILILFLIESRSGLLSLTAVYVCYIVLSVKSPKKRFLFGILTLLAIFIAVFVLFQRKTASTIGRSIILKTCFEMIKDAPLFGYGPNGFATNYMMYQAEYLKQLSGTNIQLLADNINHPLCEYAIITVNYGLVGLAVILTLCFSLCCYLYKQKGVIYKTTLLVLCGIIVLSMFSYPFRYPIALISILTLLLLIVLEKLDLSKASVIITPKTLFSIKCIVLIAVIATLFSFIPWFTAQTRWYKLSTSLDNTTAESKHLTEYEALLSSLGRSEYFLYNYAVELHYAGYDDRADSIMHLCEAKRRDYNTTLLRGDIYDKLNNFQKADSCYKLCSDMCPARFIPLYNRFNLYKQRQDSTMMKQIGNEILNKPIKVSSKEVRSIRLKIRQEMLEL